VITGIVITLNEQEKIVSVIENLKNVCDEIIVVDSQSNDETPNLAKSLGAKVICQPYLGDGYQKNIGIPHAKNDWILSLDADEQLDKDAIKTIKNLKIDTFNSDMSFEISRKTYIGNRWIKYCGWYPDKCVRLFNRKTARWKETIAHSQVIGAEICPLDGHIIHHSFLDYSDMFHKANRFSNRAAKQILESSKKVGPFSPFFHGLSAFIKTYFLKRGILDGVDGLTASIYISLCSYLKYAKTLEARKTNQIKRGFWKS